jgi:hypothetical protein
LLIILMNILIIDEGMCGGAHRTKMPDFSL